MMLSLSVEKVQFAIIYLVSVIWCCLAGFRYKKAQKSRIFYA